MIARRVLIDSCRIKYTAVDLIIECECVGNILWVVIRFLIICMDFWSMTFAVFLGFILFFRSAVLSLFIIKIKCICINIFRHRTMLCLFRPDSHLICLRISEIASRKLFRQFSFIEFFFMKSSKCWLKLFIDFRRLWCDVSTYQTYFQFSSKDLKDWKMA